MCRFQWLRQQGRRPERGLQPCGDCDVCRPTDLVVVDDDDPIDDDGS